MMIFARIIEWFKRLFSPARGKGVATTVAQGTEEKATALVREPSGSVEARKKSGPVKDVTMKGRFARIAVAEDVIPNAPHLKKIRVTGKAAPGPSGHKRSKIRFTGNCKIELLDACEHVTMEKNTAHVARHPDGDLSRWRFKNGKNSAEIELLVERLWWAVAPEEADNVEWRDRRLSWDGEFGADPKQAVHVKLPYEGYFTSAEAGFDGAEMKQYPVLEIRKRLVIPLRDFDAPQGDEGAAFRVRGQHAGKPVEFVAFEIPSREAKTGKTDSTTDDHAPLVKRPTVVHRPSIKVRGGTRTGKGFSEEELKRAGLVHKQLPRDFSFDKRRRTASDHNVQFLKDTVGGNESRDAA